MTGELGDMLGEAQAVALIAQGQVNPAVFERNLREAILLATDPDTKARAQYLLARLVPTERESLLLEALALARDPAILARVHLECCASGVGDVTQHSADAFALAPDRTDKAEALFYRACVMQSDALPALFEAERLANTPAMLMRIEMHIAKLDENTARLRLYAALSFAETELEQQHILNELMHCDAERLALYQVPPVEFMQSFHIMEHLLPAARNDEQLQDLFYKLMMHLPLYAITGRITEGDADTDAMIYMTNVEHQLLPIYSRLDLATQGLAAIAANLPYGAATLAVKTFANPIALMRDLDADGMMLNPGAPYEKMLSLREIQQMILGPFNRQGDCSIDVIPVAQGEKIRLGPAFMMKLEHRSKLASILAEEPVVLAAYCAATKARRPSLLVMLKTTMPFSTADRDNLSKRAFEKINNSFEFREFEHPIDFLYNETDDEFVRSLEAVFQAE